MSLEIGGGELRESLPPDSDNAHAAIVETVTIPAGSGIYEYRLLNVARNPEGGNYFLSVDGYTATTNDPTTATEFRYIPGFAIVRFVKTGSPRDADIEYTPRATNITATMARAFLLSKSVTFIDWSLSAYDDGGSLSVDYAVDALVPRASAQGVNSLARVQVTAENAYVNLLTEGQVLYLELLDDGGATLLVADFDDYIEESVLKAVVPLGICTDTSEMTYFTPAGPRTVAGWTANLVISPGLFPAGTAAEPSMSFTADPDTGWYRSAANTLAAATGGVQRLAIGDNTSSVLFALTHATTLGSGPPYVRMSSLSSTQTGAIPNIGQYISVGHSGAQTSSAAVGEQSGSELSLSSSMTLTLTSGTHNKAVYGSKNTVSVTGATTASGNSINRTVYGVHGVVTHTGTITSGSGSETRITYGGYFTATGDSQGVSTAYGVYASAAGADTNWAGYFVQRIGAGDGTVSLPGFAFVDDPNTGIYRIGADNLGVAVNGTKVGDFATTGFSSTAVTATAAKWIPQPLWDFGTNTGWTLPTTYGTSISGSTNPSSVHIPVRNIPVGATIARLRLRTGVTGGGSRTFKVSLVSYSRTGTATTRWTETITHTGGDQTVDTTDYTVAEGDTLWIRLFIDASTDTSIVYSAELEATNCSV